MAEFTIDGGDITSRDSFWEAYITAVQPDGAEYFGRNLDALNDAFAGGPGWPGEDFVLNITNSAVLQRNLGETFVASLREVFADSQSARLVLA